MSRVFLSTTGQGIARAEASPGGEWMVSNPVGGADVRCLAVDPLSAGTLYAGTDGRGVLRSTDRGVNWETAGLEGQPLRSIATSPVRPGVVYAGAKPPGLFVSEDGGKSWREIESLRKMRQFWWFTPAEEGPEYVQGIALSPTDPDLILIGIEFGAVLRSADGGETWSRHCRGALRDCHTMTFHASKGDWAYEGGGSGGGAAFTKDGGRTWSQPRKGLDRHYGWAVGADPAQPEIWYVSLSPGPYKAHGDGDAQAYIFRAEGDGKWAKLSGGLPQPLNYMPYALLTDPAAPGHLYAGLSNGDVWHTADYGDSWEKLTFNLGGVHRSMVIV